MFISRTFEIFHSLDQKYWVCMFSILVSGTTCWPHNFSLVYCLDNCFPDFQEDVIWPPIYLHMIFEKLQFEISSLMNWIFSLFQTWILQATAGRKLKFKLGKKIQFIKLYISNKRIAKIKCRRLDLLTFKYYLFIFNRSQMFVHPRRDWLLKREQTPDFSCFIGKSLE